MTFLTRMLTRLMALILALSVFGATLWLALYMRPEDTGGWVFLISLPFAGALGGLILYQVLMNATGPAPRREGVGAGMMVGMGYRPRQADEDDLDL